MNAGVPGGEVSLIHLQKVTPMHGEVTLADRRSFDDL
jgi:hypothetical protein